MLNNTGTQPLRAMGVVRDFLIIWCLLCPTSCPSDSQQPSAWSAIRAMSPIRRQRGVMLLGILALIVVDIIQLEAPRKLAAVDASILEPPFGGLFGLIGGASRLLPCAGSGE